MNEGKSLRDLLKKKRVDMDAVSPEQKDAVTKLKQEYNKYSGMDQSKIIHELQQLKNDPSIKKRLDEGKMDEFAQVMKSVLTPQQQQKLQGILRQIRGD